jgi:paraquat-inducible protein A
MTEGVEAPACCRCGAGLRARKNTSLQRSWALLVAAAILYIPANVLPIMHTSTLAYDEYDTIMSGVINLWAGGSWPLALLVFSVSIVVPCLKLIALSILLVSTQRHSSWRLHDRAVLYRVIEFIGRWSMLDVFVVALLVGLVQLRGVATIHAEAGAVAFASVVILTMYATQSFDPRLMWDGLIE